MTHTLELRPVRRTDSEFVYKIKKAALGEYIRQTWGWDEAFQRRFHDDAITNSAIQIISWGGADVGWMEVERCEDAYHLAGVYLGPTWQGRGIGTAVIRDVMNEAASHGVPVRLQVLKVNPRARALYERLGFVMDGDTDTHVRMVFER